MGILPTIRDKKLIFERDNRYVSISRYGKIVVSDEIEDGANVRLLLVNGTRESATYTTPGLRNEPVFEYIRTIRYLLTRYDHIKHALIIGGAGYAFPKFFISHYEDASIDVVENNPEMVDIAKKYFYLDELVEEYRLKETGRLATYIDDGLRYLQTTDRRYDLIVNDAFVGHVADKSLLSDAGCRSIYNALNDRGVYMINAITARTGQGSMPGVMTQETVSRVF